MSEEIPYAYQLKHNEQEVERLGTEIDRQRVEIAKLKELLTEIAGVAHHGGLIGYDCGSEAIIQVRILAAPYWDKIECTRLQSEAAKP